MSEQPEPKIAVPPPAPELTGRIGKYEVRRLLGRGAMGVVYLAHDAVLERDVAIKVMLAHVADDADLKKRFEREARAVARMTHPNVVTIFEMGYHVDGSPYMAMELLKGMDLHKAIRQPPPMSLERKVSVILDVLAGLTHAHRAGIVHRDIKPANIFITDEGVVKIMDFGVALLTTAAMTNTGIVGTANYMSPEQVSGGNIDGRSDLFSVGCLLYELIAGRSLFRAESMLAIFYKITSEEPTFDLFPGGEEHQGLLPILRKALAKKADDRYQTASDFAADLGDYLGTHAPSASAKRVLDKLGSREPPTKRPAPVTEVAEPTVVTTEGLGTAPRTQRSAAPTQQTVRPPAELPFPPGLAREPPGAASPARGARTAASPPSRGVPTAALERPASAVRPGPAGTRPLPLGLTLVGGLVVAATVGGVFVYYRSQQRGARESSTSTVPQAARVTQSEPVPPTAPPVSQRPTQPDTGAAQAAEAAFRSRDYDEAARQAHAALREDAANEETRSILEKAQAGQKAVRHFLAAESALGGKDFDEAARQAEAGRSAAPWDRRASDLLARIQEGRIQEGRLKAQQDAARRSEQQQQREARINDMLGKADGALQNQDYSGAIAMYQQVIALEPSNTRALNGKSTSVQAQALQQAAKAGGLLSQPGKSFTQGKTIAQSAETGASTDPPGFASGSGIVVGSGSQAAALPGKILFDVQPKQVKAGDKYTVSIFLLNEGTAPIEIGSLTVTTTVNGLNSGGAVQSQVKAVAPHDKATLLFLPNNLWKEETVSWSMDVVVRTVRGESYRNQVTWR
jgi:serine/threonine protein kinase